MRYSNPIIICLLFVLGACVNQNRVPSQPNENYGLLNKVVTHDSLVLRPNEGLVYLESRPFTGTGINQYMSGKQARSIKYLAGKKEGLYQKWFEDGTLSYEAHYRMGKLIGTAKSWWKNGQLRSIARYENGVLHGKQEQWYKSGALFKEMNLVMGKEEGMQKAWRENGKIYNNYEAKNGRIFGLKRANLCYELDNEITQFKAQ